MFSINWIVMSGHSEEAIALGYLFLKAKQDRAIRQKKKLKKLDKKIKKLRRF